MWCECGKCRPAGRNRTLAPRRCQWRPAIPRRRRRRGPSYATRLHGRHCGHKSMNKTVSVDGERCTLTAETAATTKPKPKPKTKTKLSTTTINFVPAWNANLRKHIHRSRTCVTGHPFHPVKRRHQLGRSALQGLENPSLFFVEQRKRCVSGARRLHHETGHELSREIRTQGHRQCFVHLGQGVRVEVGQFHVAAAHATLADHALAARVEGGQFEFRSEVAAGLEKRQFF